MPRLGETLISLGRQIPDIYRTNRRLGDERLDQQRRMEREDVTWEQQQEEYAKKKALEREAEDAIGRYETGIKAQTPLSEGQEGPVLPERSRFELGMEAGLPRYTEVSPQAKGLFGAISEEEKGRMSEEALGEKLGTQMEMLGQRLQSAEQIARDKGLSARDLALLKMAFQGEQKERDRTLKKEISGKKDEKAEGLKLDIKTQLEKVINHPAKYSGANVGQITRFLPTESRDFKKQFDKLKSMMTLENLKYLKGAMSDKDVAFIQSASTALDLGASPEALDRELNSLYSKFKTGESEQNTEFNSVEEAEAANLPVGTIIYINGRKAVVE